MALEQQGATVAYPVPRPVPDVPREHTVHFYDEDDSLVRVVASFLAEGLLMGDGVLVVATAAHLREFGRALVAQGVDLATAIRLGTFVEMAADDALARFVVDRVPDASRFRATFEPLIERARAASRNDRLRVYGEMVDVLWSGGNAEGTIQLEQLWNELIRARPVSLLCAYRLDGFPGAEHTAVFRNICAHHAAVAPTARHSSLPSAEEQLARVAELEQRALALEEEIERRKRAEAERTRLYEAERAARAEIALLYRLTDAANRAETLEQVYQAALDGIATALGVDRASILLFDSDGVMRFKAWRGLSDEYRAAVEGHSPWRPEDAHPVPVLSEDVRLDARMFRYLGIFAREDIGALGFFPLFHGGRLLGKFMVYHRGPHAFTEREKRAAGMIADQVAFAVDRKLATLERERLLGFLGHDLRNPLNAITMSAGSLLRQGLGDGPTRTVRRVVTSARRMERLVTQLLQLAQARHGNGIPLHRKRSDLSQVVRHVIEELETAHPDRELVLEVEGDPTGEWDADRLGEVFSNLIGNAVQHGSGGPVRVRLRSSDAAVTVEVHNGGAPIPAAHLPHLFDPFRRGPGSGAERSQGVGLGLFISSEIVRAHGGAIDVRSTHADGTTFTIRIPRPAPRRG